MEIRSLRGKNKDVWKFIFSDKNSIVEAVLYRYSSFTRRTVICCSVMSGCPVGCTFCGTGKRFIRNLTAEEIVFQTTYILKKMKISANKIDKFQIMFMSMGEPTLNWDNVEAAIRKLNKLYPDAQLLISTIGTDKKDVLGKIIRLSEEIPTVGLQFSIHESDDKKRSRLIPYKDKLTLRGIAEYGEIWHRATRRFPYLNYIVTPGNSGSRSAESLAAIFNPRIFKLTLSVFCETDKTKKSKTGQKLSLIKKFHKLLLPLGFDIRIFNPAGQDDIGGGCGQLWFVQNQLRKLSPNL